MIHLDVLKNLGLFVFKKKMKRRSCKQQAGIYVYTPCIHPVWYEITLNAGYQDDFPKKPQKKSSYQLLSYERS
jgi:hypothetical protein